MTTPRSEADMLHMQHAHVVDLLVRQREAARLKAQRDAAATVRRAAATAADADIVSIPSAAPRTRELSRPRPV